MYRIWMKRSKDLKGQLHEIFETQFFSSINPTYRVKAVSHMASYSPG
jgi:hypothetical protein